MLMDRAIDTALFRETLGHYPTGVAVVTAVADDGGPAGMVVGSFTSVSLDPPLVAFFPVRTSASFARVRSAPAFCVNVLAADQELLCRRLATSGAEKFNGVRWQPGPLGSPVLEDAVSWIECTFQEISEAGDHFAVIGRVHELAVQRSTLPLLFFQGGYGRFSPGSLIAAPDPDLNQASRMAEAIRPQVEVLSVELAVNCTVIAKIASDAVQVLVANRGPVPEPLPLGHRTPLIPPLGSVFLTAAAPAEVDGWLRRAPDDDPGRREVFSSLLDKVRTRGYALSLVAEPAVLERHRAAMSAFELSDRLPRQERAVKQVTSGLAEFYDPDLDPAKLYDVASIVVPVATPASYPPIAIRMAGMPGSASPVRIETWIQRLKHVADLAARLL